MKLKIIPLIDTQSVNDFVYATEISATAGDAVDLYFQLSDSEKNSPSQGFLPGGLRYMPVAGSTLVVTFKNIDDAKVVTRYASQPFAADPSIWMVSVLPTDPIKGTVTCKFQLTEPAGLNFTTKTTTLQAVFCFGEN